MRPARLFRWGWRRAPDQDEASGVILVEDPELLRALEDLGAAMLVVYETGDRTGEGETSEKRSRVAIHAVADELAVLAGFLERLVAEAPPDDFAALVLAKVRELRGMAQDLGAWVASQDGAADPGDELESWEEQG